MHKFLFLAMSHVLCTTAHAATLEFASAGDPVVLVLDGKVVGSSPLTVPDVEGATHRLGFRSTTFGRDVFTQSVEVPSEGGLRVTVDLHALSANVEVLPPIEVLPPEPVPEAHEPEPVPEAPESASVAVASPPQGDVFVVVENEKDAHIFLDDVDTGEVEQALLRAISVGTHRVEARTRCGRGVATIEVVDGNVARVQLPVEPGLGGISVSASPDGAQVFLNDKPVGPSPKELGELECGDYVVSLRAPGYLEQSTTVSVSAFTVATVAAQLEEEAFGSVAIVVSPLDSTLSLDGTDVSVGPITVPDVATGRHTIVATREGYRPKTSEIEVQRDVVARVDLTLDAQRRLPVARLAVDSAVTGGGLVAVGLCASSWTRSARAYDRYLTVPEDLEAAAIWDNEVIPAKRSALVSGALGATLLATSGLLWATTDWTASIHPTGATFTRSF